MKQQTTKLTITLSVIIVIMVAAAITPIKSPVFCTERFNNKYQYRQWI
jgi:hypothetical protein